MAYGSGYAGGYADGVTDNSTLEGQSDIAISQVAALVFTEMALAGQSDLVVSQAATVSLDKLMIAGQSDLALTQASDLILPSDEETLEGTSAVTVTQAASIVMVVGLTGQSDVTISQAADVLVFEFIAVAGAASIQTATSGSLKLNRPSTPPSSKIHQVMLKRRSMVMPVPSLDAVGRPS